MGHEVREIKEYDDVEATLQPHAKGRLPVMCLQTSLAEAYQRKCLYTISRSLGFDVVEELESSVGPRHFPVTDPGLLPPPRLLRRGDRVLLLPKTSTGPDLSPSELVTLSSASPEPAAWAPSSGIPIGFEGREESQPLARGDSENITPDLPNGPSVPESRKDSGVTEGLHTLKASPEDKGTDEGRAKLDPEKLLALSAAYRRAGNESSNHIWLFMKSSPSCHLQEEVVNVFAGAISAHASVRVTAPYHRSLCV